MRKSKLIVDTSAWLAYILSNEAFHQKVSQTIIEEIKEGTLIFTSNYIIDETVTRLIYDTNWKVAAKFIEFIKKSLLTKSLVELWVDEVVEEEAFAILKKFREHKLSLTDATTICLAKRLSIDAIVTLDSDFTKVGLSVLPRINRKL